MITNKTTAAPNNTAIFLEAIATEKRIVLKMRTFGKLK
jgi:hypothetical protein